jgi:hypothetical protein
MAASIQKNPYEIRYLEKFFGQEAEIIDQIGLSLNNPLANGALQRDLRTCEMTTSLSARCPSWAFPP